MILEKIKTIGEKNIITENSLSLVVDSHGAKVLALVNDKDENILYYNENDIGHSGIPLCFPNFGPLKNDEIIIEDKSYPMGQHGFIRDSKFEITIVDNSIICKLTESKESLKKWPFKFLFKVEYKISDNRLVMNITFENRDSSDFKIAPGIHPYFTIYNPNCIKFTTKSTSGNDNSNNYKETTLKDSNAFSERENSEILIKAVPDMHLINHNLDKTKILIDKNHTVQMESDCKVFNRMTIWRKDEESPYICIEPASKQNEINDGGILVKSGTTFKTSIIISEI